MGTCWSCGAPVGGVHYMFTCPACAENALMKDISRGVRDGVDGQERAMQMIASSLGNVAEKLSGISDEISNLAGIVQGGFDELEWELQQQTEVLYSIDGTLRTPSQTQAKEWREMAEQLRGRGCYDEAEQWFLKSLEMSPLDFRTYVGLAMNYLRKTEFDKAEEVLTRSLPHAPQGMMGIGARKQDMTEDEEYLHYLLRRGRKGEGYKEQVRDFLFDYKSLSRRLIGRIWACRGDYKRATAELRSAIDLSPEYPEGNYDYALYCVQAGMGTEWNNPMRLAISSQPGYLNVARAERRFAPVRQDLDNLLSGLLNEATEKANQTIQDAECKFAEAKRAVAAAPSAEERYDESTKKIIVLLAATKRDMASNDYSKILKVPTTAVCAAKLSSLLEKDARESASAFLQEKERRKNKALLAIPKAIGVSVVLFFVLGVVFTMGGCFADVFSGQGHDYYTDKGGPLGGCLGIAIGVIWGIVECFRQLAGKK